MFEASSAGTNLKVGDRSGAKVGEGAPIQREAGKNFSLVVPLHVLALKAQLVVLVNAFVMVRTVCQFLVCCATTHGAPRAQLFVKVGARAPVPNAVGATV